MRAASNTSVQIPAYCMLSNTVVVAVHTKFLLLHMGLTTTFRELLMSQVDYFQSCLYTFLDVWPSTGSLFLLMCICVRI